MAANSSHRVVASLGKRFVTQIWTQSGSTHSSSSLSTPAFRRFVHASVYDKNVEDHVRPVVVPDDIIGPQSDKYWSPNPQTGVFGPTNPAVGEELGFYTSPMNGYGYGYGSDSSVLEQKAFFRPLENLDKPQHP